MQIIKLSPGQVFLLELNVDLHDNVKEFILAEWKKLLPDNPVIIVTNGTLSILDTNA